MNSNNEVQQSLNLLPFSYINNIAEPNLGGYYHYEGVFVKIEG